MSPERPTAPAPEKITLDEVKNRAEDVRDLVVTETRRTTREVLESDPVRTALVVVGVVVAAASVAYFLGTRAGRAAYRPAEPL